jgi:hypothetical protein
MSCQFSDDHIVKSNGVRLLVFHNCTHVTDFYYQCSDLLLYFFEESIIYTYMLILFLLNISLTTSKFQPFKIFCNLCLIVYAFYMTQRYVYIPSVQQISCSQIQARKIFKYYDITFYFNNYNSCMYLFPGP